MDKMKYWQPPVDTVWYSLPELEIIADYCYLGTFMGSWLVLWAGVFALAWPGRWMR
jgi:hypothetical protein